MQLAVVQRRSDVRAYIFQGIELTLVVENSDETFADSELAPLSFRDLINTGQTNRT